MKWTKEHDVLLQKEVMLFELLKYKLGSHERGNCLDRIAVSPNQLQQPFFYVSQNSTRDRIRLLERYLKRKDRFQRSVSGISAEEMRNKAMERWRAMANGDDKVDDVTYSRRRERSHRFVSSLISN